jgi:hypothetical protein
MTQSSKRRSSQKLGTGSARGEGWLPSPALTAPLTARLSKWEPWTLPKQGAHMKLLEENKGETLQDIGLGKDFFGYDSKSKNSLNGLASN